MYIKQYTAKISELMDQFSDEDLQNAVLQITNTINNKGKLIIAGNGGSAAMASHVSVDFLKAAKIRCMNFNEADLITCYANDYGYENWIKKALESYLDRGDVVILISSSGTSPNIISAAEYCISRGVKLITLTGFEYKNPVSLLGEVNIWCNSRVYNYVEMAHHIWLVALVDHFANAQKVL